MGLTRWGGGFKALASPARRLAVGVCAVGALALAPTPAGAAVTIGETFTPLPEGNQCQNNSWFQDLYPASPAAQYGAPSDGVITSWSFEAAANAPTLLRFKTFRYTVVPFENTVVGRSDTEVPVASQLNTFDTRIPVEAGDRIGFYAEGSSLPCMRLQSGYTVQIGGGDTPLGTTNYVNSDFEVQLDISAQLEPDADKDGFGDETQDECPNDPGVQAVTVTCPDRIAPQTTILKKPKRRSTRRRATFAFSSEAGATFKCSRDGKPFIVCASPVRFRVKTGRHSFVVFAKDAAGNVDDSPATASWTVRPRR